MNAKTSEDREWELNVRHFEIRRKMILHEDTQINSRLTMLIQTQGWLVVPSTLVIVNGDRFPSQLVLLLLLVFAIVGGIAVFFFSRSIRAAMAEQEKILSEDGSAISVSFPFRGDQSKEFVKALQAEGTHKALGRGINYWVPIGIAVLWTVILVIQFAK